ncbi:MAG: hypothetical protein J5895_03975 [Alphaproteobacteria bacterium]|nr:hypothetical protein [Alphaproteobacteria bacterium]
MENTDEIFRAYVEKRLNGDSVVGSADFPSLASPSLNYLSELTKIDLLPIANTKWIREEDQTQPERYLIEDISSEELIKKREQNIENLLLALPDSLASKIATFEAHTKYLYSGLDEDNKKTVRGLKQALKTFAPDKETTELVETCLKRLSPEKHHAFEKRKQRAEEAKKTKNKRFYEIIVALHATQNPFEKINLYKELVPLVGYQNNDIEDYVRGGQARINLELKCQIYKNLSRISFGLVTVQERRALEQEVDFYQKKLFECLRRAKPSPKSKGYPVKLINAFSKGGLYGPDSSFARPKGEVDTKEAPTPKKPEIIELTLFSDEDFVY